MILGYVFGVLGALSSPILGFDVGSSLLEILHKTPAMLFWSWTNLLWFNLHNQRHVDAIEEDRINKPWRPLPANRLTAKEATHLMYAMYPVVIISSAYSGGLRPCLIEAFSCLWYNEWMGAESPIFKDFLNAAGFACFLAGPLEIVLGNISLVDFPRTFQWLVMIGITIFMTVHTQDF